MSLFDIFRKQPGAAGASAKPAGAGLLAALVGRYALVKGKPPGEASLMGEWWEGRHEGRRLAFMERGKGLVLFLGEPAEVTEIYLVREASGAFGLAASTDSPELAAVQASLPRLSASVLELQVYENLRGLALQLDERATPESVEADLAIAHSALEAIERAG